MTSKAARKAHFVNIYQMLLELAAAEFEQIYEPWKDEDVMLEEFRRRAGLHK